MTLISRNVNVELDHSALRVFQGRLFFFFFYMLNSFIDEKDHAIKIFQEMGAVVQRS